MLKFFNKILFVVALFGPTSLVASCSCFSFAEAEARAAKEYADKMIPIYEANKKLFSDLRLEYRKAPGVAEFMNDTSQVSFFADPSRLSYLTNMLNNHYIAPIKIRSLKDRLGYGVATEENLLEDDFIGEYAGGLMQKPTSESLSDLYWRESIMRKKSDEAKVYVVDASPHGVEMN